MSRQSSNARSIQLAWTSRPTARLQMLEAQIEPHFLFNTLANVRRLYDTTG